MLGTGPNKVPVTRSPTSEETEKVRVSSMIIAEVVYGKLKVHVIVSGTAKPRMRFMQCSVNRGTDVHVVQCSTVAPHQHGGQRHAASNSSACSGSRGR